MRYAYEHEANGARPEPQRDAILVVEDSADTTELIGLALERSGIEADLIVAHDGIDALDLLFGDGVFCKRYNALPKLILLDLKLPRFKGDQVLQVLKSDARTQGIPIVVLSSSDLEIDQLDSLELGATAFVKKPTQNFLGNMVGILEAHWPTGR
jgi:two-component system, response regulator